ncbi:MAG TPA: peptidoglycan bridge formation glycyltransferase FemA/FemB family protein [Candidatus Limnocylindrales bacterium]|nr:peptidoglycan bridge formation glycyltransferase FemA/FemB family protein [Candidatus Limnocylindrales bacterium]
MTARPTVAPESALATERPAGAAVPESIDARNLERDDDAWNAFVEAAPQATWLQATPWAAVKRPNGWSALRAAVDFAAPPGSGPVGAQILVKRVRGLPWGLGYIPRGPVGMPAEPEAAAQALIAFTARLREVAREHRLAEVRMEPEVRAGEGVEEVLQAHGWRSVRRVQWHRTRLVDLRRPQEELWQEMHRKARQSVTKSRRLGVRVVTAGGERLADYHRVYQDSAARAGMFARSFDTFSVLWDELSPRSMVHLSFAELEDTGEPVATLLLTSAGGRAFDMYGGTTVEGEKRRANYLLKWEALVRCQEQGFHEYDLWGLPHSGIAQFKAGFGGREVTFIGAWSLATDRIGNAVLSAGLKAREAYVKVRHRGKGVWEGAPAEE